jgi:hypothetical protein
MLAILDGDTNENHVHKKFTQMSKVKASRGHLFGPIDGVDRRMISHRRA